MRARQGPLRAELALAAPGLAGQERSGPERPVRMQAALTQVTRAPAALTQVMQAQVAQAVADQVAARVPMRVAVTRVAQAPVV